MKLDHPPGTKRYINFRNECIELTYCEDGLWRSESGCIFGYMSGSYSTDDRFRYGVGLLSAPEDDPLSIAARPHDYKYSCPVYQTYHTRQEADADLAYAVSKLKGWRRYLALPTYWITRLLGGLFWEDEKTR